MIYKTTKQTHTLAKENKDFHQAIRSPPAGGEGEGGGGNEKAKQNLHRIGRGSAAICGSAGVVSCQVPL